MPFVFLVACYLLKKMLHDRKLLYFCEIIKCSKHNYWSLLRNGCQSRATSYDRWPDLIAIHGIIIIMTDFQPSKHHIYIWRQSTMSYLGYHPQQWTGPLMVFVEVLPFFVALWQQVVLASSPLLQVDKVEWKEG